MKIEKYSQWSNVMGKNDSCFSMNQSYFKTGIIRHYILEYNNNNKIHTNLLVATHKLKRVLTPVLSNSYAENYGNFTPCLDNNRYFLNGLFVDVKNKNGSMEEMMTRKISQKNICTTV